MSVSCLRELTQQLQVLLKHSFSLSNISRWLHDPQSIDRQQALTMLNIAVQSPPARFLGRVCWWNMGWQHQFFLASLEILVPLAIATIVKHHENTWAGYQSRSCQFLGTLALFVLLTVSNMIYSSDTWDLSSALPSLLRVRIQPVHSFKTMILIRQKLCTCNIRGSRPLLWIIKIRPSLHFYASISWLLN